MALGICPTSKTGAALSVFGHHEEAGMGERSSQLPSLRREPGTLLEKNLFGLYKGTDASLSLPLYY